MSCYRKIRKIFLKKFAETEKVVTFASAITKTTLFSIVVTKVKNRGKRESFCELKKMTYLCSPFLPDWRIRNVEEI